MRILHDLDEVGDHQQVLSAALGIGRRHLIEEARADNAAGAPDLGDGREGQVPTVLIAGLRKHREALGIGDDLAGKQRPLEVAHVEMFATESRRLAVDGFGGDTLVLAGRDRTGSDGAFDRGRRHAQLLCRDHRPGAGALLAGLVENEFDQWLARHRVDGLEHISGDLDQVGVERTLVPFLEDAGAGGRIHAEAVAHDAIDLGDHLHVAIFDAVVDGLDEVAGAAFAQIGTAGLAIEFGRNRLKDRLRVLPLRLGAAHHDRGAVPGALLTARHTDAEIADALRGEIGEAAVGVGVERVAAFEDGIALFEQRQQLLDHVVDRLAGLDHDDDRARALDRLNEGFEVGFGDDLAAQTLLAGGDDELVDLAGGAVVHRDRVALLGNVERQIRAHHGKADKADVSSRHSHSPRRKGCFLARFLTCEAWICQPKRLVSGFKRGRTSHG